MSLTSSLEPSIIRGKRIKSLPYNTLTPRLLRAIRRSVWGRARICSSPSILTGSLIRAASASINLAVVPLWRTHNESLGVFKSPLEPCTTIFAADSSASNWIPNSLRHPIMARVSSAYRALVNVEVPCARDAITNALFVMLFEPESSSSTFGGFFKESTLSIRSP